jgi:hypothetical protein
MCAVTLFSVSSLACQAHVLLHGVGNLGLERGEQVAGGFVGALVQLRRGEGMPARDVTNPQFALCRMFGMLPKKLRSIIPNLRMISSTLWILRD